MVLQPRLALLFFFSAGIRSWVNFARVRYGSEDAAFPPQLGGLLEWSHTFRCVGTYSNYLGYVRSACLALGIEIAEAGHPALLRAKIAVTKRMLFTSRLLQACVCVVRCVCLAAIQAAVVSAACYNAQHGTSRRQKARDTELRHVMVDDLHLSITAPFRGVANDAWGVELSSRGASSLLSRGCQNGVPQTQVAQE